MKGRSVILTCAVRIGGTSPPRKRRSVVPPLARRARRTRGMAGWMAVTVLAAGCAGPSEVRRVEPFRVEPAREMVVIGDWNDVEAAAIAAAGENETAIVGQTMGEREQVFEFQTIMDEPGKLIATRETEAGDLIPIRLRCEVGSFGNEKREEGILESARKRLRELAGVQVAPRR